MTLSKNEYLVDIYKISSNLGERVIFTGISHTNIFPGY